MERLPVMICPRWVYTRTQPIAIDDALASLVAALEVPESQEQIVVVLGASGDADPQRDYPAANRGAGR